MSEMSSLSHEYASAADFSRQINDAVLLLKKRYLSQRKSGESLEQGLQDANSLVRNTLQTLLLRLDDNGAPKEEPLEPIPEDVLVRIETKHRSNWQYVRDDLKRIVHLLATRGTLGQEELALLDSVCEAADASASATFRKLWRR